MRRFRPFFGSAAPAVAALILAGTTGCSSIIAPTAAVSTNSQFSTAVLQPGGSNMTTFTLNSATYVGLGLVAVTSTATGQPLAPSMTLVLGTASGATTCTPLTTKTVTPELVAQIQQTLQPGTYCASVTDQGLGEAGVTTLRINTSSSAPTNVSNPTSVDIFSSTVGPTGTATHQLPIAFNGVTSITFVSASTTSSFGVAIGVWDGQACRLSSTVTTPATGSVILAVPTDPGNYCLRVFDIGQFTAPVLFTLDTIIP